MKKNGSLSQLEAQINLYSGSTTAAVPQQPIKAKKNQSPSTSKNTSQLSKHNANSKLSNVDKKMHRKKERVEDEGHRNGGEKNPLSSLYNPSSKMSDYVHKQMKMRKHGKKEKVVQSDVEAIELSEKKIALPP